jgi:hypothetical protein
MPQPQQIDPQTFSGYRKFNDTLRELLFSARLDSDWESKATSSLDGEAGAELRRLVDLEHRRAAGAFFTGSVLAGKLLRGASLNPARHFIYDPTVGAGDLLIAAAKRLPVRGTLKTTLQSWGACLAGTDINPEFVEATKLRIALLARQRHGQRATLPKSWRNLLPHIRKGDGHKSDSMFRRATHVLLNPPYNQVRAPQGCAWSSGRVSNSAIFVMEALEKVSPNTQVLAILPDVLRSGSFQHHWREQVSDLARVHYVKRHGLFDRSADVDVFLLQLRRRSSHNSRQVRWPTATDDAAQTVGDYFNVHVGRVVPHRDPTSGRWHPYIHPRNLPLWKEINDSDERRRHEGKPYRTPFVALRRTSRPGDRYRAAAAIVKCARPVAVENHLIVCEPLDGLLATCRALVRALRSQAVNDFLDEKISCRHLTVGAVAAIPFQR